MTFDAASGDLPTHPHESSTGEHDRMVVEESLETLLRRARSLASRNERVILGITGAPGAGKSTLAQELAAHLGDDIAVHVPMDGFHLANRVLDQRGLRARKGAPNTFDGWGYRSLLMRIRRQRATREEILAPEFRRDLDEAIGSAITVGVDVPLVITEGNYMLLPDEPWQGARRLCDAVWFLATPESQRIAQLVARHEAFGLDPDTARLRSFGNDQENADVIALTSSHADLIVRWRDAEARVRPLPDR